MRTLLMGASVALALAQPAAADVHDSNAAGFAVRATATAPVSPAEAWEMLLDPAEWWSGTHTFSGDAANLTLDPRAGGCFCELLPGAAGKDEAPRGAVQHMQVVFIDKARTLRLSGALGPLQSEPVTGTLTFLLKESDGATRINAEYAVGGYLRIPAEKMAPIVDRVISEQVARLAAKLGGEPVVMKTEAKPMENAPAAQSKPIIGR